MVSIHTYDGCKMDALLPMDAMCFSLIMLQALAHVYN